MNGYVDDQQRALIHVAMSSTDDGERREITAWIDTAFNGGFVLPRTLIDELGLVQESSAEAVLANGQTVELETFACRFNWFGKTYDTQVIANDGDFPLLGTMLLAGHRLVVDYEEHTVEIS